MRNLVFLRHRRFAHSSLLSSFRFVVIEVMSSIMTMNAPGSMTWVATWHIAPSIHCASLKGIMKSNLHFDCISLGWRAFAHHQRQSNESRLWDKCVMINIIIFHSRAKIYSCNWLCKLISISQSQRRRRREYL